MTAVIDPMRVAAMHATLGRDGRAPRIGESLPPFWHWAMFWIVEPPGRLGRDGHPAAGTVLPDTGLPRRMWAGGEIEFLAPVIVGQPAERRTVTGAVAKKTGRSGPLAFVRIEHEVHAGGALAIREAQDLVFREDEGQGARPEAVMAATNEEMRRDFSVTTTDLFRYSALTFNGHRIHYDVEYARQVEGYAGLVVHGPLLAQRLIEMAADELGPRFAFAFRARAPVFHTEGFSACARGDGDGLELWVRAEDGRLAMTASARPVAG